MPLVASLPIAAAAILAFHLSDSFGWRLALLFLVGIFAGVVLYHASFGFTSAWRVFLSDRRSAGLRAQMVMLILASTAFSVLLSMPQPALGVPPQLYVAPLSSSIVAGAFLFGIGMQLGGGCASGTPYTVGSGNTRMVVTLAAFVLGALLSTWHAAFWATAPSLPPVSLLDSFGPVGAVSITFIVCGGIGWAASRLEKSRHGGLESLRSTGSERSSWLRGPWPLLWGAVGLVVVNVATLVLAGRPWGITWPYWSEPARAGLLNSPVLGDVTSVMNIGIVLGALTATGFAGRFAPLWRIPLRSLAAALIGGLLLGYGARIAFGCNIGAFFGGVASASLHGWLWFVAALAGNAVGVWVRPWFGLKVEHSSPSC
jgi:uncharacterized membrane protein YedE/YeeE